MSAVAGGAGGGVGEDISGEGVCPGAGKEVSKADAVPWLSSAWLVPWGAPEEMCEEDAGELWP